MANSKQGFVFYKDWEDIFNCFESDSDVADLLRSIFAYVRRGEKTEFNSEALNVAYTVMVNTLMRDGLKWEQKCAARAAAGRASAEKRKKERELIENLLTNPTNVDFVEQKQQEKSSSAAAPPQDKTVKAYGEFMHVLLSADQHEKLLNDFGQEKTAEYIRRVDEYTQQTGKQYKDFYLTIRKWIKSDDAKNRKAGDSHRGDPRKGENASLDVGKIEQIMNDKYRKKAPDVTSIESTQKK